MEDYDIGNEDFVDMVYQEINDEGFDCASLDMLLEMWKSGEVDTFGDVVGSLSKRGKPDWAAEVCRMAMTAGGRTKDPDYGITASTLVYLVDMDRLDQAHELCKFLLVLNEDVNGYRSFDCYDLSFVLGHMVKQQRATQAGKLLYAFYTDDSPQGQLYQPCTYSTLGTLMDYNHLDWAVELSKQLMYGDKQGEIDYSVLGWIMSQMALIGRPDWAAQLCDYLMSQQLPWYSQQAMLNGVAAWGGVGCSQAVAACQTRVPAGNQAAQGTTTGSSPYTYLRPPAAQETPPANGSPAKALNQAAAPFVPKQQ